MEGLARQHGVAIEGLSTKELNDLWDEVKRQRA
jgi:hypothetical protein